MSDYMAWADSTAAAMRDYYEANKPLHWWQRRRVWNDNRADDLMLGLMNVALNSFAKRESDARVLEPYHLGKRSPK